MVVPAPRLRRVALVVLLDRCRRTALLVQWAGAWAPLAGGVGFGSSYEVAAAAVARVRTGSAEVRYGAVVGHVWATGPAWSGTRVERRLLLAVPAGPLDARAVRNLAEAGPLPARWWTAAELRESGVPVRPPELPEVVDGYLDGRLPDGPLTLDWR
ncbi:hypothetical protein [Actinacidiphila oryziradicis]|uniref:hypothetical protein n=1 Tax=Actinacidiphila oryziradicis TaxID=2571141 RepID=UPI0023EFA9A1|nr:hypothetical protein [Actinacidiphila oryziradicis]